MQRALAIVHGIFIYVLYPAVVLAVFGVICNSIIVLTSKSREKARAIIAGVLPVVMLVFAIVDINLRASSTEPYPPIRYAFVQVLLGALIGILYVEAGRVLNSNDTHRAVNILFLSTMGSLMLYITIRGSLGLYHPFLVTSILAGGLNIVFRGTTHADAPDAPNDSEGIIPGRASPDNEIPSLRLETKLTEIEERFWRLEQSVQLRLDDILSMVEDRIKRQNAALRHDMGPFEVSQTEHAVPPIDVRPGPTRDGPLK